MLGDYGANASRGTASEILRRTAPVKVCTMTHAVLGLSAQAKDQAGREVQG
jgi:hypothetical protein